MTANEFSFFVDDIFALLLWPNSRIKIAYDEAELKAITSGVLCP
jgi:hypothetical protein